MRILHVITGLDAGGCETMLWKLLSASNGQWDQAVVSLGDQGAVGPRISDLGIPVHPLGMDRTGLNAGRAFSLVPLARRLRPRLVIGWMPHGNLMASLAGFSLPNRVPVLWNIRMSLEDIASERRRTATLIRFGALFSHHPAAIIYNSHAGAKQHESIGYRAANRVVISNGFDCDVFRPDDGARRQVREELGIDSGAIVIGLVARYHPTKDHAGFLRAGGIVARAHPEARFLLSGGGVTAEEHALRNVIAECRLQGRVLLLGERSDMPRIDAALDIACSSSWGEGCPNTIGEAMACGVPCVVTGVGDSAYLVGDTGLSVPPRNPEALARAIGQLVAAGPAHRQQLGEAARKRIETDFSLPAVARRYEELYREHLARSPRLQGSPDDGMPRPHSPAGKNSGS